MTTTEIIQQAAKAHLKENYIDPSPATIKYVTQDFKAGAEWALSKPELMREEILEFVSWRDSMKIRLEHKHGKDLSDDELFTLYLEQTAINAEKGGEG